ARGHDAVGGHELDAVCAVLEVDPCGLARLVRAADDGAHSVGAEAGVGGEQVVVAVTADSIYRQADDGHARTPVITLVYRVADGNVRPVRAAADVADGGETRHEVVLQ